MAAQSQQGHLTTGPSVMFARLNSQGRVIVGMSNGDGYAYNASMYVWQRLSDSWWAVGSQYWNTTDTSLASVSTSTAKGKATERERERFLDEINPENISAGIIPLLERNTTSHSLLKGKAYFLQRLVKQLLSAEGFEGFESSVSIAHIENRLAAAQTLGAKDEFRVYLIMYAKRIGAEGLQRKVEELLSGLAGKVFTEEDGVGEEDSPGTDWSVNDEIVGWKREELLREVVIVLGKHRDLQRITTEYSKYLSACEEMASQSRNGNGMDEEMVS